MFTETEYLEVILKGLVKHPDYITVSKSVDERGTLLTVDLHPDDMGVIIGRDGKTAQGIRTIMRTYGLKDGEYNRINVLINEPR